MKKEGEKEREYVCVCTCVCVCGGLGSWVTHVRDSIYYEVTLSDTLPENATSRSARLRNLLTLRRFENLGPISVGVGDRSTVGRRDNFRRENPTLRVVPTIL